MEPQLEGPVYCPKCNQLNDAGVELCVRCQGHLYVHCRTCGTKNQRMYKACAQCGADLHRVKRKRKFKHMYFDSGNPTAIIVGVIIMLLLVIASILWRYVFK